MAILRSIGRSHKIIDCLEYIGRKPGSPRLLLSSFSLLRIFEKLGFESQLFRRTQKAESEKLAFLGGPAKHGSKS